MFVSIFQSVLHQKCHCSMMFFLPWMILICDRNCAINDRHKVHLTFGKGDNALTRVRDIWSIIISSNEEETDTSKVR